MIHSNSKEDSSIAVYNKDSSTAVYNEDSSIAVYLMKLKKHEKNKDKNDVVDEAICQIYGKRYIVKALKLFDDHKHLKWTIVSL